MVLADVTPDDPAELVEVGLVGAVLDDDVGAKLVTALWGDGMTA